MRGLLATVLLLVVPAVVANEATDRAAIEAAAQEWVNSFNLHDIAAMLRLATGDVVLLDPSLPPVSGNAVNDALQRASTGTQLTTATREISIAGDVAWRIGVLQPVATAGTALRSDCLEIWKRVDGTWKLHRQMSSGMLAPLRFRRPLPSEPMLDQPRN